VIEPSKPSNFTFSAENLREGKEAVETQPEVPAPMKSIPQTPANQSFGGLETHLTNLARAVDRV
jgi:hypothetical protein